jgi:hypothetical protein
MVCYRQSSIGEFLTSPLDRPQRPVPPLRALPWDLVGTRGAAKSAPMNTKQKRLGQLDKARTRVAGFDDLSGGGLPAVGTTLICGGGGSDKTLFAVTFLR